MRRTFVLAVVLCLTAVAALGIAAAPAAAQSGCDCHTLDPPTATAAHAPFVASVTECATCHVDWVVPHPDPGWATVSLSGKSSAAGYELTGRVWTPTYPTPVGHPDVVVYLQQRLWGATEFTDLAQVTTDDQGVFAFTVASPAGSATYRAIVQGHVGPGGRLIVPLRKMLRPTPRLTLKLGGLVDGSITLGHSVTAKGTAQPAKLLLSENVSLTAFRKKAGEWVKVKTGAAVIGAGGGYGWKYEPGRRGSYKLRASLASTANHRFVRTTWRYFKVI